MARSAAARVRAQPPLDTLAHPWAPPERQFAADLAAPALFEPAILHVRVPHFAALLPEERVIWDEPAQTRGHAPRALAVQIGADGQPTALRRAAGAWEQGGHEAGGTPGGADWEAIRSVCAHWRLRTRWWARTTHRYYYLVETARGALLEIYQEREDGRWWLTGRRD